MLPSPIFLQLFFFLFNGVSIRASLCHYEGTFQKSGVSNTLICQIATVQNFTPYATKILSSSVPLKPNLHVLLIAARRLNHRNKITRWYMLRYFHPTSGTMLVPVCSNVSRAPASKVSPRLTTPVKKASAHAPIESWIFSYLLVNVLPDVDIPIVWLNSNLRPFQSAIQHVTSFFMPVSKQSSSIPHPSLLFALFS